MRFGHRCVALAAAGVLAACGASAARGAIATLPTGADVTLAGGTVQIVLVRHNVLRVHFLPQGQASPPDLVMSPRAPSAATGRVTVRASGARLVIESRALRVVFDDRTAGLQVFRRHAARPIVSEAHLGSLARRTLALRFSPANAPLYGVHGFDAFQPARTGLLRTGRQLATAGAQGDAGAPLVWSTAGFAVLLDSQKTLFDLTPGRIRVLRQTRPDPDYYLIISSPRQIFSALDILTGHAPLFPKWSLGFINSQWGINERELLHIVRRYRALKIPLDAFSLDFDWKAWGQNNYGEFRWNTRNFPDGPSGKLDRELTTLGVHLIGIMKPRIHVDTTEGEYASTHHLWIPGEKVSIDYFSHRPVKTLDFDNPATRRWFFNPVLRHSFATGIVGWWNDEADETGDDKQFFNMERALYDGQRHYFHRRVWSLNRNFWLGAQRYAYGLWSGDIHSGFASMAAQRQRMLSAIDVGEMWWGMDGGGFHGHPSAENYARWIEFDAFAPICRVHGSELQRRQPWIYGQTAARAATAALDLRYRLMPYIYSYAWHEHVAGIGLVRPLMFSWPQDLRVRNDYSAWLFGRWLLVSPVVHRHQRVKHLYLPPGRWTNYFTGKVYRGGATVTLRLDNENWTDIPLFVRAGAIIPTQPLLQYVGQHPVTTVAVQVFPARHPSRFDYYDDNGRDYAYEHNEYFLQRIAVERIPSGIDLTLGTPRGAYQPALRHFIFAVHGVRARRVDLDARPLPEVADRAALGKCPAACWARGHDRFGEVVYVEAAAGRAEHVRIDSAGVGPHQP